MLHRPNIARWFGIALLVASATAAGLPAAAAERTGTARAHLDPVEATGSLNRASDRLGRTASDDSLRSYCVATLQSPGSRVPLRSASRRPSDCIPLLATRRQAQAGEAGRPGRGDGGMAADFRDGEPGLPPLFERSGEPRSDLIAYCTALLQSRGRRFADAEFSGSDCAYYMLWLERSQTARAGRPGRPGSSQRGADGPDGASIDGGVGGAGGRAGSGPGGGRGGAGGAGVGGGLGGAGGAGGSGR
ncbi:hypothetical protein ACQVP2_04670 [Methylobacterium aquaticum]|uniref:hypothetical protein n=1 Tax=Methylobacterium aquaticum TaxID=270351 RepID=UPI003D175D09